MAFNINILKAQFQATTKGITTAFNKLEKEAQSTSKKLTGSFGKVGGAFSGLINSAKSFKTILSGIAIGGFFTSLTNEADKIQKFSQRLGVSTEQLSRLKFAGEQTGVAFNQLSLGLQRANRRIAEASQGTGEAVKALDELGLEASELNKLSPDKQLSAIADALEGVENQSDKVRLAFKLFDSEGVALLQTLDGGSEALDEFGKEADRLGITLNSKTADALVRTNDEINRAKQTLRSAGRDILVAITPAIDAVAQAITLIRNLFKGVQEALGKGILNGISNVFIGFTRLRMGALEFRNDFLRAIADILASLDELVSKAPGIADRLGITGAVRGARGSVLQSLDEGVAKQFDLQEEIERARGFKEQVSQATLGDDFGDEGFAGSQDGDKPTTAGTLLGLMGGDKTEEEREGEFEALEEELGIKAEIIKKSFDEIKKAEEANLNDRLKIIDAFQKKGILSEKEAKDAKTKIFMEEAQNFLGIFAGRSKKVAMMSHALALWEKKEKIQSAIQNTAEGISRAFADYSFPVSAGVALAVGALGAVQIANIVKSAVPSLPSFYTGGGIIQGNIGRDANVVSANVNRGEVMAVMTQQQQRGMLEMMGQLKPSAEGEEPATKLQIEWVGSTNKIQKAISESVRITQARLSRANI